MASGESTDRNSYACLLPLEIDHNLNISMLPLSVNPTRIAVAIVNGIAAPPTITLNILVIWTVLEDKKLRSNSYNVLLACMAFTDLLIGLVVQPVFVWSLGCLVANCQTQCLYAFVWLIGLTCLALTISTLMMASLERYLAIEHPYVYCRSVTRNRAVCATAIACMFTPSFLLLSRLLLRDNLATFKKVAVLFVATVHIIIIVFCTVKVQIAASQQRRKDQALLLTLRANEEGETAINTQELKTRLKECKHAFTMNLLVLATFVCFSPIIITAIIEAVKGSEFTDDFKYIAIPISATFINLQSMANPLTVSLRMSAIRKGIKKKLFCRYNVVENEDEHGTNVEMTVLHNRPQVLPRPTSCHQEQE